MQKRSGLLARCPVHSPACIQSRVVTRVTCRGCWFLSLTGLLHARFSNPTILPLFDTAPQPITVVRFVIGGTIEERILKLQDKKRLVFEVRRW